MDLSRHALVNQAFTQIKNASEFIALSWTGNYEQFANFQIITFMDKYCYKFYNACLCLLT